MKVAIATPISLRQLAALLDQPVRVPPGFGGIPPLPEVRALIARRHDVSVVTLDPDLTSEVVLRGDRLTVHLGPFREHRVARDGFRIERQFVAPTLLRCQPDVAQGHWTYEIALGALATGARWTDPAPTHETTRPRSLLMGPSGGQVVSGCRPALVLASMPRA